MILALDILDHHWRSPSLVAQLKYHVPVLIAEDTAFGHLPQNRCVACETPRLWTVTNILRPAL